LTIKENTRRVAEEVADILLDEKAVLINSEEPFVYTSGVISPIYCDMRLLMRSPASRRRIVELLGERILESCGDTIDVVAGVATAGISWASWLADLMGKPMAYVRDAPKGHGRQQQVEGGVESGQSAIVVEDLTSTGSSALTAVNGLREIGASVDYCVSIFTYEFPRSADGFQAAAVEPISLCGVSTLLDVATANDRITAEAEQAVREWLDSQSRS
jgi:orotate phosphoribosyltransferase